LLNAQQSFALTSSARQLITNIEVAADKQQKKHHHKSYDKH
jgi:hypothetical protein